MEDPHPLAPGLYLVATPIGNLGDITLRALDVLKGVDRIACEDTRQTQKLLNHFGINTPTESCHEHNEQERAAGFVEALKGGARIAVVTDAGMPGISDPGSWLVSAAIAAGISVFPFPVLTRRSARWLLRACPQPSFIFLVFSPRRLAPGVRVSRRWPQPESKRARWFSMKRPTAFSTHWQILNRSSGRNCA